MVVETALPLLEDYVPVYKYGGRVESNKLGKTFTEVVTGI
jgi:hypothetical protein